MSPLLSHKHDTTVGVWVFTIIIDNIRICDRFKMSGQRLELEHPLCRAVPHTGATNVPSLM